MKAIQLIVAVIATILLSTPILAQTVNVTVDQKLHDGTTTVDSIDRWQSSSFVRHPADTTFSFSVGTNEVLRGTLRIISSQKYNNWSSNSVVQTDVTNHHLFGITSQTSQLTSDLVPTNSGNVIKAELIDAPNYTSGSTVQFSDPWLRDTTDGYGTRNRGMSAPLKERSSPFHPDLTTSFSGDVYQGVFLNQNPRNNVPYYSVGVDNYPSVYGSAWNNAQFLTWTSQASSQASLTSPVVFTSAVDTVRARFKGSGISSTTVAFDNNSQQKAIFMLNAGGYIAYESAGGSFRQSKTGLDGSADNIAILGGIPSSTVINRSPSLFTDSAGTKCFEVWEQIIINQSHTVMCDGELQPLSIYDLGLTDSSFHAKPVVGVALQGNGLTSVAIIVFRTAQHLVYMPAWYQNGSWQLLGGSLAVPGSDGASTNPTIAGTTFDQLQPTLLYLRSRVGGARSEWGIEIP